VKRYGAEHYVPVIQQDHVWDTNWKLLCENFLEGYHASVVHQQTVGAGFNPSMSEFPPRTFDGFSYHLFHKDEDAKFGRAHENNARLEGSWRSTSVLGFVFPTHLYSLAPDYLWYLSLRPLGVGQVHVRIGVAVAPEVLAATPDREAMIATLTSFFDQANAEDRVVVEGIFRGSHSHVADSGPLSWLERSIHDFMGYLSRMLGGIRPGSAAAPLTGKPEKAGIAAE